MKEFGPKDRKSHAQGGPMCIRGTRSCARAVFSSSTSQLTAAVGEWYAGGWRQGGCRSRRCWASGGLDALLGEREGIRARGKKRLGRILWRAVAGKQHVTWKAHRAADDESLGGLAWTRQHLRPSNLLVYRTGLVGGCYRTSGTSGGRQRGRGVKVVRLHAAV